MLTGERHEQQKASSLMGFDHERLPTHLTPCGAHHGCGAFARRRSRCCGDIAIGGAAEDQPGGCQISDDAEGCDGCVNFQPPNACKFVEGNISPSGWCQLFAAKTKS